MFARLVLACVLAAPLIAQPASLEFYPARREVVEARLRRVVRKNPERELTLRLMLEEAGCNGSRLVEQRVKGSRLPNVICTLPGDTSPVIIAGGHFDASQRGMGAVDNWSGVSLLPSLYEALAARSRRHTFVFIGFTAEEDGLIGSRFYVRQLSREQVSDTKAMLNLDSLGLSGTKIWLHGSDPELAGMLAYVAERVQVPLAVVNMEAVGSTDSAPFAGKKIPVVSLHSVTQETLRILHSPKDRLDAILLDEYYASYRLAAAFLTYLDQQLE